MSHTEQILSPYFIRVYSRGIAWFRRQGGTKPRDKTPLYQSRSMQAEVTTKHTKHTKRIRSDGKHSPFDFIQGCFPHAAFSAGLRHFVYLVFFVVKSELCPMQKVPNRAGWVALETGGMTVQC